MYKYVTVDSRKIRYRRTGAGPAVILIHGLSASCESWSANIPALARDFTVYALDPGFGMSDRINQDIDINFFDQFMARFMDTIEIENATLVGHSMGGYIATRMALGNRNRIENLVLVNSGGFGRIYNPLMKILRLPFIDKIMGLPTKLGTRLLLQSLVYNKNAVGQDVIDTHFRHSQLPGANKDILRVLLTGDFFNDSSNKMFSANEIQKLSMPTMVIWGSHDSCFPMSQAKYAHSLLPNGQLHILDKCGHMPQIEHTAKFNDLLSRFLRLNIKRPGLTSRSPFCLYAILFC